ncbi:Hypothetical predicted protein [Octopus vulgaris]|uniref:Uncharacterized protein n=1 Tax=Octopus vulgaris TaxID=6645 RepID=A0AA36F9J7_OCTVU|nr:Hypothetical predicted protein [Octopus vulgaris]
MYSKEEKWNVLGEADLLLELYEVYIALNINVRPWATRFRKIAIIYKNGSEYTEQASVTLLLSKYLEVMSSCTLAISSANEVSLES